MQINIVIIINWSVLLAAVLIYFPSPVATKKSSNSLTKDNWYLTCSERRIEDVLVLLNRVRNMLHSWFVLNRERIKPFNCTIRFALHLECFNFHKTQRKYIFYSIYKLTFNFSPIAKSAVVMLPFLITWYYGSKFSVASN